MSTKWVVTAAAEQVALDDQRQGETAFTVTNPGDAADRVVFDPVGGDGTDPSWFSVDDPQRLVRGGASVSYLVKLAVPADATPGPYEFQARVYSVDSAPEESSVLSPRVRMEVAAPPEEPAGWKPPWWVLVAGAGVLVLLVVVGVVVLSGGDGEDPAPATQPTALASGEPVVTEVAMPDLLGMSERQALDALSERGLTALPVQYRHDAEGAGEVVAQSSEPDQVLEPGTSVELEVAIELLPPVITAPVGVPQLEPGDELPLVVWESEQREVRRWRLVWEKEWCSFAGAPMFDHRLTGCSFRVEKVAYLDELEHQLEEEFWVPLMSRGIGGNYNSGWVRVRVAAQDDFGIHGPYSEWSYFRGPVL